MKEVIKKGKDVDWTKLPVPIHTDRENDPYITAMNIIRDPETGFYNSCHAGTTPLGPDIGETTIARSRPRLRSTAALVGECAPPSTYVRSPMRTGEK